MNKTVGFTYAALSGACVCLCPNGSQAADEADLQEIVVTAQKVAEPLSKVPLTVSALSGSDLENRNFLNLEDFKGAVPGVQVNNYIGEARINIRGIGANSLSLGVDPQVSFNLNGVYSTIFSADAAFLDVDRIELLRGPQGTLYGRNSTGGAVNIYSKLPTRDFEALAQLRVGNYGEVAPEVVVSGGLIGDTLLGRVAASSETHSGYSLNLYDGRHYDNARAHTVRATLLFKPSDAVTVTLIGDYHDEVDGNYAVHLLGTSPGYPVIPGVVVGGTSVPLDASGQAIDPRLLSINTVPENHRHATGVVNTIDWKVSDTTTLKSITSYRTEGLVFTQDFDSTTWSYPSTVPGKDFEVYDGSTQYSQEFQLAQTWDRIRYVAGFYYFHDQIDPAYYWLGLAPSPAEFVLRLGGTQTTRAYAGFGQATFAATDHLNLTAGIRYSHEARSANQLELLPQQPGFPPDGLTSQSSATWSDVSPKFTIDYQWRDGVMAYATVSKGFQSGGYDVSAAPLKKFDPETVWDYEAGFKYRTRWLSADLSAFHYKYSKLQVAQIVDGLPSTTNAADSKIDGVELTTTVKPWTPLSVTTSLSYLNARFTRFEELNSLTGVIDDLAGNKLPGSTRYSSNVLAEYSIPIPGGNHLTLSGEWNWHDRLYFTEFNSPSTSQPSVSTYNAAARFTTDDGRWLFEVWGKNLSNELIRQQAWITGAGFGQMALGQFAPPLTWGATVRYAFR
jgi:iron complex outermembrane receptor protein